MTNTTHQSSKVSKPIISTPELSPGIEFLAYTTKAQLCKHMYMMQLESAEKGSAFGGFKGGCKLNSLPDFW